ncbi:MAG: ferritin-like domain-containing protein [Solirubrobacterales bacterium]|nr:ferritin-like domain-containing protein [Solirubrobacterales bacterium]
MATEFTDDSLKDLEFGELDQDGAIAEAVGQVWGDSRADFLRKAVLGSGVLLSGLSAAASPAQAKVGKIDKSILNYALVLEYLQADFYSEAERLKTLKGQTARQARVVGAHERSHVKALRGVLGRDAVKRPSFNFRGVTESPGAFRRTAVAFEDLSVAAYAGQAPRIESKPYLVAALGILSVEARHASWIRRIAGREPAARAFDEPRPKSEVLKLVRATRFVSSGARTTGKRSPRYTG